MTSRGACEVGGEQGQLEFSGCYGPPDMCTLPSASQMETVRPARQAGHCRRTMPENRCLSPVTILPGVAHAGHVGGRGHPQVSGAPFSVLATILWLHFHIYMFPPPPRTNNVSSTYRNVLRRIINAFQSHILSPHKHHCKMILTLRKSRNNHLTAHVRRRHGGALPRLQSKPLGRAGIICQLSSAGLLERFDNKIRGKCNVCLR